MNGTDVVLLVVAALLVPLAGVLAGVEAALVRVSRAGSRSWSAAATGAPGGCWPCWRTAPAHQPAAAAAAGLRDCSRRCWSPGGHRLVGSALVRGRAHGRGRWSSSRTSWSGSGRARSAGSTRTGSALSTAGLRARPGPGARPAGLAAHPHRQRDHAGAGLPRGAVRDRGRAARAGRPGRAARGGRARRARDDPLGVRARRHDRPRGDGAAHRRGLDRARQDRAAGARAGAAQRLLPDPGGRRQRRRRRRHRLPQGPRRPGPGPAGPGRPRSRR